ncbi:MAG: aerobic respiration control sensor protein ArcB [Euryarchaeota archaeon ADurb.Bin294]|jgi:PAS domain S-box-containing protein|nr:PAS domain S-box protein [Methanospirillum sp.]MBP9007564.1 PAS domain S-box protein [Methanospirillum sp.]OQA56032.1 MAG: aerobic respiration control sensor protein ArcB [Euryarchaeota archaeon ADurb.Bin294]
MLQKIIRNDKYRPEMNRTILQDHTSALHVLVVDDEEDVRLATAEYLAVLHNIKADLAGSGEEALLLLLNTRYDAIISDYEMEDMSGIDLLKTIRARGDDTPFIIFTGRGREEVVIAAFENGADGYVMKGGEIRSQFAELAQKVTTIAQKKQTEKALSEIQDQFAEIYINSPIAIELYDKDGRLLDINPACCDLFGVHSSDDVRGFSLFDDPNVPKERLEALKKGETIRYRSVFDFDLVKNLNLYTTSKAGKITIEVQITPMYHGDHQLSGYLVHIVDVTEETHAQDEIKNQKLFLDRLLETIPIPVFYNDTRGRYIGCNQAFEHYIGFTKEQIVGKTVYDIAPQELADTYYAKDKELLDAPKTQTYESQVWYADGTMHNVIFYKATLLDQNGNIQGLIGMILDITERKQAEEVIRQKEEYIRTVLDNLPIGVAVNSVSPTVAFSYHNANFLKFYRIPEKALKEPDVIWDYIYEDPEYRKNIRERVISDCASGDPSRMHWDDIPIIREGEETTYISAMNIPIPLSTLMISTVWDVTARKKAEDELKQANRLLEGMLNGIPDIIGIQNPDHTIIRYNQAGYDALGLSPEEVAGKPCYSFIGRTRPCEICATSKALQSKKQEMVEKYVPELKRYLICRSNPILDDDGNVQLIVEQLTDITDRKQIEEAIGQSNQKLRLLTGLTRHDILNILTAIYFYHELALENSDPNTIHEYITRAQEAGKRIEATIGFTREYEEFGIVSSGWQELYSIIESAKREINVGAIRIENQISTSLLVYADPIIRKVFSTLIENAIRHGKKITYIRFSVAHKDNDLIIICEDNGVGIPLNDKAHIFGRGFGNHTGIGLFLAREILSITNLSIREVGEEGKGARFEILVPDGKWRE